MVFKARSGIGWHISEPIDNLARIELLYQLSTAEQN